MLLASCLLMQAQPQRLCEVVPLASAPARLPAHLHPTAPSALSKSKSLRKQGDVFDLVKCWLTQLRAGKHRRQGNQVELVGVSCSFHMQAILLTLFPSSIRLYFFCEYCP